MRFDRGRGWFGNGVRERMGELVLGHCLVSWLGWMASGGFGPRDGRGEEATRWRSGSLAGHGYGLRGGLAGLYVRKATR